MADYFVDSDDVLENKLGITDPNELMSIEQEIVTNKTSDVLNETPQTFGLDYLLHVHRVLFEEIYDFAGKIRTIDISKPDASMPFAYAQFLEAESKRILDNLASRNYLITLMFRSLLKKLLILQPN